MSLAGGGDNDSEMFRECSTSLIYWTHADAQQRDVYILSVMRH